MTVLPLLVGALTTTEPELRRTGESIWHCIPLSVGKGNAAQISDSVKTVEVGSIVWTPAAPAIFFESNEVFFHEWWNGKKSGPLVVPRRVGSVFSRGKTDGSKILQIENRNSMSKITGLENQEILEIPNLDLLCRAERLKNGHSSSVHHS